MRSPSVLEWAFSTPKVQGGSHSFVKFQGKRRVAIMDEEAVEQPQLAAGRNYSWRQHKRELGLVNRDHRTFSIVRNREIGAIRSSIYVQGDSLRIDRGDAIFRSPAVNFNAYFFPPCRIG